uniref:SLAIN motif-containing protein 1-like n=1 Tax=Stegastes partitus TaxID=144197 RepID=A0A3B5BCL6_9TELE
MEAAVLNPAMVPEVDCNSNSLNAELEVKKLQELVRKLERQNEQLRTRAGGCTGGPHALPPSAVCVLGGAGGLCLPSPALLSLGPFGPPEEPFDYFHPHGAGDGAAAAGEAEDAAEPSVLDELELLDLDSLSCSDESDETWLYVASSSRDGSSDSLSPLQWCRQVLDSPRSEVEAARRSLSLRLEQGRSLRLSTLSPQSSMDDGASEAEDDSIALGYKLQDLTDVQVMARLQEESLRQDYASTSSVLASRRSQSFSFQLSQLSAGPDLEEEDEEDDEDYGLLPPPPPRLTRLPHSHTFSSIRDWRRSTSSLCTPPSTPSTPPYPSAGFVFQPPAPVQGPALGNKLRRSMPNLVRAPSMPSVPIPTNPSASPALLRNSQSFDSSSGLTRLQSSIPSPGQLQNRVQSVGNFSSLSRQPLKATAYVSPTIKGSASLPTSASLQSLTGGGFGSGFGSGIPLLSKPASGPVTPTTPRSGLPRPASFVGTTSSTPRSKVAQPARSLLTPPKSLSTLSALRDSTWRDGCY